MPAEPFWRNPSGAQIVVALIGAVGAITAAVITVNAGSDNATSPTSTPRPASQPVRTTAAKRGTILLSPDRIQVKASSTLPSEGLNTYDAGNTIDGDPQTAWSEGKPGPGIGTSLTWTFASRIDLRRMTVLNGYVKGDLFHKNLRIRAAKVVTSQGETTATLRDTPRYQPVSIRAGPTDFVRLVILAVYGSQRYEDCLLSEAEFFVAEQ